MSAFFSAIFIKIIVWEEQIMVKQMFVNYVHIFPPKQGIIWQIFVSLKQLFLPVRRNSKSASRKSISVSQFIFGIYIILYVRVMRIIITNMEWFLCTVLVWSLSRVMEFAEISQLFVLFPGQASRQNRQRTQLACHSLTALERIVLQLQRSTS